MARTVDTYQEMIDETVIVLGLDKEEYFAKITDLDALDMEWVEYELTDGEGNEVDKIPDRWEPAVHYDVLCRCLARKVE